MSDNTEGRVYGYLTHGEVRFPPPKLPDPVLSQEEPNQPRRGLRDRA